MHLAFKHKQKLSRENEYVVMLEGAPAAIQAYRVFISLPCRRVLCDR